MKNGKDAMCRRRRAGRDAGGKITPRSFAERNSEDEKWQDAIFHPRKG
jgi:hypothetical protein